MEDGSQPYVSVEDFYSGKSVFITGGSGFLGKVLIEKLVNGCPNISNVYVLVRGKKNVPAHERLKKILDCKIFTRIKLEKPENMNKIIPIVGDVTHTDLGLTIADKMLLIDTVSIVFHLAATIKFNEPLSEAMRVNVEGTRNVIQFSKQMKNIQAFLYMSTAFSHTDKLILEEIIYPSPMKIDEVYEFLKLHGNDKGCVQQIIKERPNTYTFTKAITESLVADIRGDMPTVIIRPSVVVAAMREPIRGWIDSWFGPTPVLDAVARGWVHCLYGEGDYAFDIIPIDYVVNATIVAAARCKRSKKIQVYNCSTSTINKLSLREVYHLYTKESMKRGYNDFPLIAMVFTKSSLILKIITLLFQTIPAYIFDFVLILKMKPTRYVKMQQKLAAYMEIIKFFSSRSWIMMSTRLRDLSDDLDAVDQHKFPCNPAQFSWSEYIPAYFDGVVKFLIGD